MMLFGVNGFTSAGNDAIQAASTKRIQQKTTTGRDGRIATTIVRHDDNAKTKSLGEIPLTASSYDAIRDMVMKDEEKSKLTAKSKKRGSTSSSSSDAWILCSRRSRKDGADATSFPSLVPQFDENDFTFADASWKHRPAKNHNGKFTMCLAGGKD